MAESAGGDITRMQAVQTGLLEAFTDVPVDASIGLRVYGASVKEGLRSCKDSSLIAPVDTVDKPALVKGVESLKPLGNTPIGYALGEAADDLPGDKPASIVLVARSAGGCGADPCQVARDVSDSGQDLHIDVVGFQADKSARDQLTCIASASGGTYFDVTDAADLPIVLSRLTKRGARGYAPAGRGVEGGPAAASAVSISDGQWLDTIGDSDTEYYRLLDPAGGTLHVAATIRPVRSTSGKDSGSAQNPELTVDVTSLSGVPCGDGAAKTASRTVTGAPTTVVYTLAADKLTKCGEGPYTLAVASTDRSVRPLELLVASEPAVTTTDGLPKAVKPADMDATGNTASEPALSVVGSPSFSGAPALEPATYDDTVRAGTTRFYHIGVDWGQQLVCDVDVPAQDSAAKKPATAKVTVRTYGPQRQRGSVQDKIVSLGKSTSIHTAAPPVRYLNRKSSSAAVRAASRAGGYYCAVSASEASDKQNEPFPVRLTASVVGTAGEGTPVYADKPESAQDAVEVVDDGGTSPLVWIGVGLVAAAAAGSLWFYLRRRHTARDASVHE